MTAATAPTRSSSTRPSVLTALLAATIVAISACSTAAGQLGDIDAGAPTTRDEGLPFGDDGTPESTVDSIGDDDSGTTSADYDGPTPDHPIASPGPTLVAAGEYGVFWFDPTGVTRLVVEPSVAADYDGSGGLVFQRSEDGPIVRRDAGAEETVVVTPASGETVGLLAVESSQSATGPDVIYVRATDESRSLEALSLGDGSTRTITSLDDETTRSAPHRVAVHGGYVTAVYRNDAGSGWVTRSLATGSAVFGTLDGSPGPCVTDAPGCAEIVTVSADLATVYSLVPNESQGWSLVLNRASDFAELARVDVSDGPTEWIPTTIEPIGSRVIVSRSRAANGSGALGALVVEPASGVVEQLADPGSTRYVAG